MKKIKTFMLEHKVFFIILLVAISLLGLEYVLVNNYVDKKTNPTSNRRSNKVSNINDLTDKQKKIIGINTSNTNENSNVNNANVTTETIVEKEKEKKQEKLSNSNINRKYEEYEKLSDEEKEKIDVVPSKNKVDIDELDKIDDKKIQTLPSKFKLQDKIQLNFQNQGGYGLCWNFASTKVFETYLALNYNKQYDFSEIAVDYISSRFLYNETNSVHDGANFEAYNNIVKRLGGLIESKNITQDYYHKFTEEEYKNLFKLPRVAIENYEVVNFPRISYYDNHLTDSSDNVVTEEDLAKYREAMKKHIMTNSALFFSINSEATTNAFTEKEIKTFKKEIQKIAYDSGKRFFCKNDDCYRYGNSHAMALIGWDDNFDRKLFKQIDENDNVYYPEHDGAFIIANSWNDKEDLYYISYDDTQLYENIIGIKKLEQADRSKYFSLNNFSENLRKSFSYSDITIIDGKEYVSNDILDNVQYLNLNNKNLTTKDLNDLKYFKNLTYLEIAGNNISDLSFLNNLQNLTSLDISNNNVTDITTISNMSKIDTLDLSNNKITDITPIKDLYELEVLILDNNQLTIYENTLNNLNNLRVLSLDNCNINNLSLPLEDFMSVNLSNNPNLNLLTKLNTNYLELNNNNLLDLSILNNIEKEKLYGISLVNNDIKDISLLKEYKKLSSLNLSGNKNISNINPIVELFSSSNTEADDSNDNKDKPIAFLGGILNNIKKLDEEHIDIEEDAINEDDMNNSNDLAMFSISELYLDNCNISDISLFNKLNVSILSLKDNNITSVDNFNNKNVHILYLSNNKLENLNLGNLLGENINELYLSNVGLKEIVIDKKFNDKYLSILDLSNNDITDLSKLNNVTSIDIISLENNENLKEFNLDIESVFVNLSNTGFDDSIADKINFEKICGLNLSNTKNISNINEVVDKINKKVTVAANEKMKERMEEDQIDENSSDYEQYKYIYYYLGVDLVLDGYIINRVPYDDYIFIDADFNMPLTLEPDGSVDLLKSENFALFKFLNLRAYEMHNVNLSRDLTKMYITNNSYLEFDSLHDLDKKYTIKFN